MIKFDIFVITLLSNILGSFLAKDGGSYEAERP